MARWTDGPVAALDHVRATGESAGRGLGVALEADLLFDTVGEAAAVEVASPLVEDPASDHDPP